MDSPDSDETYCELCGEMSDSEGEDKENLDKIENSTTGKRKRREKEKERTVSKEKRKVKDYRVKYIGESWRSAYERGLEHQDDYRNLRVNSHMLKHAIEEHPEKKLEEMKFGMRVKMQFKSALERQVTEAVDIHQALRTGNKILNS